MLLDCFKTMFCVFVYILLLSFIYCTRPCPLQYVYSVIVSDTFLLTLASIIIARISSFYTQVSHISSCYKHCYLSVIITVIFLLLSLLSFYYYHCYLSIIITVIFLLLSLLSFYYNHCYLSVIITVIFLL